MAPVDTCPALKAPFFAPERVGCYQHVQAIIVAIDQYAEAALGNRDFFLNRTYSIGGGRTDDGS
jgi:hypothetical protein